MNILGYINYYNINLSYLQFQVYVTKFIKIFLTLLLLNPISL